MKDIIELVSMYFKNDEKIWYVIILFVVLWIFKEVRTRYIKEYDFEITRLDKVIEVYGALEMYIINYLHYYDEDTRKNLYEKVYSSYAYISKKMHFEWCKYTNQPSRSDLEKYLFELRKEAKSLKSEQESRIPMLKKDIFAYCFSHVKTFFMPAYITVIMLLLLLLIVLTYSISLDKQLSTYAKIDLFSTGSGVLLYIILIYFVGQLFLDNRLKHSLLNWLLILGLAVILVILAYFKIALLFTILYFLYMHFFASKLVKQTE